MGEVTKVTRTRGVSSSYNKQYMDWFVCNSIIFLIYFLGSTFVGWLCVVIGFFHPRNSIIKIHLQIGLHINFYMKSFQWGYWKSFHCIVCLFLTFWPVLQSKQSFNCTSLSMLLSTTHNYECIEVSVEQL